MAEFVDTSCIYSTVRNTSGKRRFFGFLPPHGRTLAANEEFSVFGHITAAVVGDVERATSRHHMAAFERAIEAGDLEILSTPAPILLDQGTEEPVMLEVTNGTVASTTPCFAGTLVDSEDPYEPY